MNLFSKAAQFERLCGLLAKTAQNAPQIDPSKPFRFNQIPEASLTAPTPRFSVPTRSDALDPGNLSLDDFASFLTNFDASKMKGVSVDVEAVKRAGDTLSKAVAAKNNSAILSALKNILSLTQNGGGVLYGNAQKLFAQVQKLQPKATPAGWLNEYMANNKSPAWLDQYMAGEEADEYKSNMQTALNDGSAVKPALDRQPYFPDFKRD